MGGVSGADVPLFIYAARLGRWREPQKKKTVDAALYASRGRARGVPAETDDPPARCRWRTRDGLARTHPAAERATRQLNRATPRLAAAAAQRNPPDPPARQRHRLLRAPLAADPGHMRLSARHVPCRSHLAWVPANQRARFRAPLMGLSGGVGGLFSPAVITNIWPLVVQFSACVSALYCTLAGGGFALSAAE